jgi:hypothetical protein
MCLAAVPVRAHAALPPDSEYVTVNAEGQLVLRGRRVRFWGTGGHFPTSEKFAGEGADMHAVNVAVVRRLKRLGFNIIRLWRGYEGPVDYEKGDGSPADILDHFVWRCKKEGIKLWCAGMNKGARASAAAADIVGDPETFEGWKAAMKAGARHSKLTAIWDPRQRRARLRGLRYTPGHLNKYTRLRWGDDPVFVVWELTNEQWWFYHMIRGQHLKVPQYFLGLLYAQFNEFLRGKYGTDDALRKAWYGNLLEGESLAEGTIALLPLGRELADEAQAISLGVRVRERVGAGIGMDAFNNRRGADVIEFLLKVWIEAKQAEHDLVRKLGKSCRLSPIVWDTGIGWNMPTQYMHQHADAVAHSIYINGTMHPDSTHRRFPWWSALEELPKMAWDRPWSDHNRTPGKPFFVYEHNIMQPAKYRGEHAMRIAQLASIQDWDIICWHYWGFPQDPSKPEPYRKAMDYTISGRGHPQGYHFQYDDVLQSAATVAGEVFRSFNLKPAPEPTTFVFGRKALYNMDMMGYGAVGERFLPTVYRHGMRLLIDPTLDETSEFFTKPDGTPDRGLYRRFERDGYAILGPSRRRAVYEPCPIRPTDEISHDYQRGNLVFDAPGAAVFTGFFADHGGPVEFAKSGLALREVEIVNDAGIAYPVAEDEKYLTFGVTSTDGRPLAETRRALLTCMSTSFNSGFIVDESKVTREWFWPKGAHPKGAGSLPILYARVRAELEAPALRGMRYRLIDWHFRTLEEGVVEGDGFVHPADKPVFLVEFTRD